jgi:hypothetical protein
MNMILCLSFARGSRDESNKLKTPACSNKAGSTALERVGYRGKGEGGFRRSIGALCENNANANPPERRVGMIICRRIKHVFI